MQLYLPNIPYSKLIFFDIEYDKASLVQISLLILSQQYAQSVYALTKSLNVYVKQNRSLTSFFKWYTNITNTFLCDNGIDLAVAKELVDTLILDADDINDTLLVSHGIKNDLDILEQNGIMLKNVPNHFCTYNESKKLLHRYNHLTLHDVALEAGYSPIDEHNAYGDVWSLVHVFCYLNELANNQRRCDNETV